MTKRRAPLKNRRADVARRSSVVEIPKDLAATIKRCWPRGVVEEFPADESYFHEVRHQIERDLGSISGALLVWQTEEAGGTGWEDDDADEPTRHESEWQSYQVFFVSPNGEEFHDWGRPGRWNPDHTSW